MGRIEKLKRQAIQEANERNLGILTEQEEIEVDVETPQSESEWKAKVAEAKIKWDKAKQQFIGKRSNLLITYEFLDDKRQEVVAGSPYTIKDIAGYSFRDSDGGYYEITFASDDAKRLDLQLLNRIGDVEMRPGIDTPGNKWLEEEYLSDPVYGNFVYNPALTTALKNSNLKQIDEEFREIKNEFKVPDADFLGAIEQDFGSDLA